MSSIIKILVDIQCLVYCDFEEVGEASPNSIFKIELRKGTYIIDFRVGNTTLKTIKYSVESDDIDYLLEVSLAYLYTIEKEKKRRKEIFAREVSWVDVGDNWRIIADDDATLNSATGESWIDLPNSYNLLPMGGHRDPDIDACGYIPFNIGGTLFSDDLVGFFISRGKWGCLDKSGKVVIQPIYDSKVFFQNDQVAGIWNCRSFEGVINIFGEKVFTEYDTIFPIDEVAGYYEVSKQSIYGIIDKYGRIILPLNYLQLGYHTNGLIWAQDTYSNKWGLIRFDATIVLPFIYDKINKVKNGFFVCDNEKWGAVDYDGRIIVDTKYRVVAKVSKTYYNANNPLAIEDDDCVVNVYSIVKLNKCEEQRYGVVDTIFDSSTGSILFNEIIPCKYDAIYYKNGKQCADDELAEDAAPQPGAPDGTFEIKDVYFVTKNQHMECDNYDDQGNITYSFICDDFNSKYKILSQKYYLRYLNFEFDDNPYDILQTIDFYDGTYFTKYIYPEDWDGYSSIPATGYVDVRHKISFLIGKKDDVWCVFDNKRSNTYDCKMNESSHIYHSYNNRPTIKIFSYICDKIVEFGILCSGYYFAIVEIGSRRKLFIISDSKLVFESELMIHITSMYYQLSRSNISNIEKDLNFYDSLENDYFIARLYTGKWQILKFAYNINNLSVIKSPEFDSIRFIDKDRVEVHLYHNGRTLFNTMSTLPWDSMRPDSPRWKLSPFEERNCNWVAAYDFEKGKEGVVIEEHNESAETDYSDGNRSVERIPERVIIPFQWDYVRVFYSKENPIIVVGEYTGQKSGNFLGATNEVKCAVLDTNLQYISNFIYSRVSIGDSCQDLCFKVGNFFADVNLVKDDFIYGIPFLNYHSYDESRRLFWGSPFKNVRCFIDTETTGLPLDANRPNTELDNWPYLVQVAIIVEDDNYGVLARRNIIIKPDGYTIPESSTQIHGISNESAVKNGEERNKVIPFLDFVLYNSDIIIGHNVLFDLDVIKCEIIRVKGQSNVLFDKKKPHIIDTMEIGMLFCKIPNLSFSTRLKQPYKYPKLNELYYKLFNKHFNGQHDAMADVQATYDCYYELKRKSE